MDEQKKETAKKEGKELADELVSKIGESVDAKVKEIEDKVDKRVEEEVEKRLNETPDPRFKPPAEPPKNEVKQKDSPLAIQKALDLGCKPGYLEKDYRLQWSPMAKDVPENISADTKAVLWLIGKMFKRHLVTRNVLDKELQEAKAAYYEVAKAYFDTDSPTYQKLLSEGAAPGSLTIFTQLIPELVRLRDEQTYSNLFRTIRVSQPTGSIPVETAISRPYYVGEGHIKPQDDPTATHVDWDLQVCANVTIISRELLADAVIDWGRYIVEENLRGLDLFRWEMLAIGAGGVEPVGYGSQAFTNTNAAAHPLTYADLMTCYHALAAAYRPDAIWLMNDNAFAIIDGLLDTTNRPVFDNQQAPLQTIKGRPVYLNSYIAGTAAASPQATELYFTNPNYWTWFVKGGLEVDFNDRPTYTTGGTSTGTLKSGWERDEVGYRFEERNDGQFLRQLATSELTNVY